MRASGPYLRAVPPWLLLLTRSVTPERDRYKAELGGSLHRVVVPLHYTCCEKYLKECYNYTMKSKWFKYKKEVLELRQKGISMTAIERQYGIPRSTLSYWFKDLKLTDAQ